MFLKQRLEKPVEPEMLLEVVERAFVLPQRYSERKDPNPTSIGYSRGSLRVSKKLLRQILGVGDSR